MQTNSKPTTSFPAADMHAGIKIFIVALPLYLGIAFSGGASVFAGVISGVIVGMITGFFFQIREQHSMAFEKRYDEALGAYLFTFGEFISFISKGNLQQNLESIPENTLVRIDASNTKRIDLDVLGVLRDFREYTAKRKNIRLEIEGLERMI